MAIVHGSVGFCALMMLLGSCSGEKPTYTDLEILGTACYPSDSCSPSDVKSFLSSNCECDSQCGAYDDCCVDAKSTTSRPRTDIFCQSTGNKQKGVYVINKCQRRWRGSNEMKNQCEIAHDMSDPLLVVPMTDTSTNKTYLNQFCAECNSAHMDKLEAWVIKIHCKSLEEMNETYWNISHSYIMEHLTYLQSGPYRNQWGLYYWNNNLRSDEFHTCNVYFDLPLYLKNHIRFCRPNLVSTCAPNYRRERIRKACPTYTAVVYYPDVSYRNPHCALCNNEVFNKTVCGGDVVTRNKRPMSFTLLLDVNMKHGSRVGEILDTRCSGGEKYDPFFHKCREVVCGLPGYKLVRDRCQRS